MHKRKEVAVVEAPKKRGRPRKGPEATLSKEEIERIFERAEANSQEQVREQQLLDAGFLFDLAGQMDVTAVAMISEGHVADYEDEVKAPDSVRAVAKRLLRGYA